MLCFADPPEAHNMATIPLSGVSGMTYVATLEKAQALSGLSTPDSSSTTRFLVILWGPPTVPTAERQPVINDRLRPPH